MRQACTRIKKPQGFEYLETRMPVRLDGETSLLRRLFDSRATARQNNVCERHFLTPGLRTVEDLLDHLEDRQDLIELGRLIDFPVLLRCDANPRPVRITGLVGPAEELQSRSK